MPKRKPASTLKWDADVQRYRGAGGQFVGRNSVHRAIGDVVSHVDRQLQRATQQFADGKITLYQWQMTMRDTIRAGHTLAAAVANGGRDNMTPADWGRVGQQIRRHYEALNRFATQIENGKPINKGRVRLYAKAIRSTFQNAEKLQKDVGQRARWVRTKKESCDDCLAQARRGVQLLVAFPEIGSLQCLHNCGCYLEFVK